MQLILPPYYHENDAGVTHIKKQWLRMQRVVNADEERT